MSEQKVLFAGANAEKIYVLVQGEATMKISSTLKKFMLDLMEYQETKERDIFIDLQECSYMDSTFIGTLIVSEKTSKQKLGKDIIIANPSEFCREALENMGLLHMLDVRSDVTRMECDYKPLEFTDLGKLEKALLMYEAHEELSKVSEDNKKKFELVQKYLKKEIDEAKKEE